MKRMVFSRLPLGRRLPFFICLLLLSIILIFGIMAYIGVRQAELRSGKEGLQELSSQLGSMVSNNTHSLITTAYTSGNSPAIVSFLQKGIKDSTGPVINHLNSLIDSSYVHVSLKNKSGKTIIGIGKQDQVDNLSLDTIFNQLAMSQDSGLVGAMHTKGDNIFYPIVVPVYVQKEIAGFLVRWRKMNNSPASLEQLSKLMGSETKLYLVNKDGSIWTDMLKPVAALPVSLIQANGAIQEFTKQNEPFLISINPVKNGYWLIAIERSKKKILISASQFLNWLIIAGIILLVTGVLAAWIMSRKITRPLIKLTTAVTNIAAGHFPSFVHTNRQDEIGNLARAFNTMSVKVRLSQEVLMNEAKNYRLLFNHNPVPMWIASKANLQILDVNQAAVEHYGYLRQEFLELNSIELRPAQDVAKYIDHIRRSHETTKRGIWRHIKKDGTVIMVEVASDNIIYHDEPAILVLANDVTERLNAEATLVRSRVMEQQLITETTIQVQEQEREEFGKELHDNINQILASTKLYLEMALGGDEKFKSEAISKSYNHVNLAIQEIRRLSKKMVAPSLETSLVDVIYELTEEIQAITPISISLSMEEFDESYIDDNLKLMLYRIIQEQVNNILKYAAAEKINLSVKTEEGFVHMFISDNGIGFDTSKKAKGIGLRNIARRVKFYHGDVKLSSQPGQGTQLEVSIPLKKNNL